MSAIKKITGLEILDSRGRPTVKATIELASGVTAQASVPSGASTGEAEALELRDGDAQRYDGLGCRRAVAHIEGEINDRLAGKKFGHVFELDQELIALDGTPNKSRLGANAILAVSLVFAKAQALEAGLPLFRYFAGLIDEEPRILPRPTINLFSGGLHAGKNVPIQDCLVVPVAARTMDECLSTTYAVYQAAARLIREKYGMRLLTADEGGLSPDFHSAEEMLSLAIEAIRQAGYEPGGEVALALDIAASHFYRNGRYHVAQPALSGEAMVDLLRQWVEKYPIISLEDGLAENDWDHWPLLKKSIEQKAIVLGDDLLCTNERRIQKAIDNQAANALLLKVNQIGTLYEASRALHLARSNGWAVTISARSGETEDDWLADLATGWSGDYIKIGSINQSERLAKYNRLLEIEKNDQLPLAGL